MPILPRCTCGYTKFAERVDVVRDPNADRWHVMGGGGGFGDTPFGVSLGGGLEQVWGRFRIAVITGIRNTVCLSCARVRRGVPVGGGVVMGSWLEGGSIFTLMSDVVDSACIVARFSLGAHAAPYEVPIEVQPAELTAVPPLPGQPLEQRPLPPVGAVVPRHVYRTPIPAQVEESGLYELVFRDRCLGTIQRVIELELGG
jgi:hypothetical protein